MVEDPDEYTLSRHLEAYLLWLFGWTMFTGTHGDAAPRWFIHLAQQIADAPLEAMPQYSWASAVLAATYRGLCDACTKSDANAILTGCPLLLQLWSYTRFHVGRPKMDFTPFPESFYGETEDDGPTAGTVWCCRRVRIRIVISTFMNVRD